MIAKFLQDVLIHKFLKSTLGLSRFPSCINLIFHHSVSCYPSPNGELKSQIILFVHY